MVALWSIFGGLMGLNLRGGMLSVGCWEKGALLTVLRLKIWKRRPEQPQK